MRITPLSLAINRQTGIAGGGGGAFAPDDIASLTFWIDPDDATTRTGSGVVTTITDKVGGLVLDGFNSPEPFSNTGDVEWIRLESNANLRGRTGDVADAAINFGSGELTIALSFYTEEATTNMRMVNKGSNTAGRYALDANRSSAGDGRGFLHDGSSGYTAEGAASVNDGYPHTMMLVRDNATNLAYLYVDNVEIDTVDVTSLGDIDETATSGFLSQLLIGAAASGAAALTEYFTGLIGEILFFDDALSTSDRNSVQTYLANKWALDTLQAESSANLETEAGDPLHAELL